VSVEKNEGRSNTGIHSAGEGRGKGARPRFTSDRPAGGTDRFYLEREGKRGSDLGEKERGASLSDYFVSGQRTMRMGDPLHDRHLRRGEPC